MNTETSPLDHHARLLREANEELAASAARVAALEGLLAECQRWGGDALPRNLFPRIDEALAAAVPQPPRDDLAEAKAKREAVLAAEAKRLHEGLSRLWGIEYAADYVWAPGPVDSLLEYAYELHREHLDRHEDSLVEGPAVPQPPRDEDEPLVLSLLGELDAILASWRRVESDGSDPDVDCYGDILKLVARFREGPAVPQGEPPRERRCECPSDIHKPVGGCKQAPDFTVTRATGTYDVCGDCTSGADITTRPYSEAPPAGEPTPDDECIYGCEYCDHCERCDAPMDGDHACKADVCEDCWRALAAQPAPASPPRDESAIDDEILTGPLDTAHAILRQHGFDPHEVGARGAALVARLRRGRTIEPGEVLIDCFTRLQRWHVADDGRDEQCIAELRALLDLVAPTVSREVDEAAVRASERNRIANYVMSICDSRLAERIRSGAYMATERPAASGKDGATRDKGEDLARRTKVHDEHRENVAALLREGCICGDYAAITGALHPDCRAPHPDEVGERIRNAKPEVPDV